jgi:deazaflavin-dependent oxidoreductase (nitroreductase family)
VNPLPGSDADYCYLTTLGRRSGRPHTVEIWFGASGKTLYVLSGGRERADWVRNLRALPEAEVRVGGRLYGARARELDPGSEEDGLARRLLLEKYQAPGASDLEEWGRTALAVAFDLRQPDEESG